MRARLLEKLIENRLAVLLALLVSTAVAVLGLMQIQFQESSRDVLYSSPETSADLDRIERSFGSDQNDCYVIFEGRPIFSAEGLAVLRQFVAEAKQLDGVAFVNSMLDARRKGRMRLPLIPSPNADSDLISRRRAEAMRNPIVAGQLLSRDASATLVVIRLEGSRLNVAEMLQVVRPLEEIIARVTRGTEVQGTLTGIAAINCEIVQSVKWAMVWFSASAAVICLTISISVFRSTSAALITFTAPLIGCLWALGLLAWMGVSLNVVHSIMPTLIVATGFSDAVHLMYHFRSLLRNGTEKREAITETVVQLGPACALTSMTTSIGFGSLALSPLPVVKIFGLACAMGCALTFASVIVTFVALTEFMPFGAWRARNGQELAKGSAVWLGWVFDRIAHQAPWIAAVAIVGVVVLAPLFLQLKPNYRYDYSLPERSESAAALRKCDDLFGGCLPAAVLVSWQAEHDSPQDILPAVIKVHEVLENAPNLSPPVSVLTLLQTISRDTNIADDWGRLDRLPVESVSRLIRKDHRILLVMSRMPDQGSQALNGALDDVREALRSVQSEHPGLTIRLSGIAPMAFDSVNQIISDLSGCLIVASIVIFVVLTLAFRSVGLGMLSVIPNAFPVVALAAAIAVTRRPLTYSSVLVFTIALGIAVDDTIHFIFRYKHERQRGCERSAAARSAFLAVGPAMLTTTLIFIATFASLRISAIPQHHALAILCGGSMVLALAGDLVILPALLLAGDAVQARRNRL